MADSASEMESMSDTSSIDGGTPCTGRSNGQVERLQKRIESLQQENRVFKMELEAWKLKCKSMQEENKDLRRASVNIQARAEQEEEAISNKLLKTIQSLKKEKETLAMNYEQEEEFLTNDLSRKLFQLRKEKVELEQSLEKEQEYQVNKLMQKITKLEADIQNKQSILEQLRREKVELENQLEQEQEAVVNNLWKRMEKLEAEKRLLQEKLDQPLSKPPSPQEMCSLNNGDTRENLTQYIGHLRSEVHNLRYQLKEAEAEHLQKKAQYQLEEAHMREENLRLQRKLQLEIERRESLRRVLSESESSLEIDDERHFNEMSKRSGSESVSNFHPPSGAPISLTTGNRPRTISSPIPFASPNSSRPLSPGCHLGSPASSFSFHSPSSPMKMASSLPASHSYSGSPPSTQSHSLAKRISPEKFIRPTKPASVSTEKNCEFPPPSTE